MFIDLSLLTLVKTKPKSQRNSTKKLFMPAGLPHAKFKLPKQRQNFPSYLEKNIESGIGGGGRDFRSLVYVYYLRFG